MLTLSEKKTNESRGCWWHIQHPIFPEPINWVSAEIYADSAELYFILNALATENQDLWDAGVITGNGMTWNPINCDTYSLLRIVQGYHNIQLTKALNYLVDTTHR